MLKERGMIRNMISDMWSNTILSFEGWTKDADVQQWSFSRWKANIVTSGLVV